MRFVTKFTVYNNIMNDKNEYLSCPVLETFDVCIQIVVKISNIYCFCTILRYVTVALVYNFKEYAYYNNKVAYII